VRLGRQHVRNGVATLKTEKGGFTVEVNLPILAALHATLDAGPCGDSRCQRASAYQGELRQRVQGRM
jgi:hypothetical protein